MNVDDQTWKDIQRKVHQNRIKHWKYGMVVLCGRMLQQHLPNPIIREDIEFIWRRNGENQLYAKIVQLKMQSADDESCIKSSRTTQQNLLESHSELQPFYLLMKIPVKNAVKLQIIHVENAVNCIIRARAECDGNTTEAIWSMSKRCEVNADPTRGDKN